MAIEPTLEMYTLDPDFSHLTIYPTGIYTHVYTQRCTHRDIWDIFLCFVTKGWKQTTLPSTGIRLNIVMHPYVEGCAMVRIRASVRMSLVAQTVKNLLAVQEIWVQPLCWEDPLEMGIATHSSILA